MESIAAGMFDGWMIGVSFIVLLAVMPLGSAGIAVLEHRHLEKVERGGACPSACRHTRKRATRLF